LEEITLIDGVLELEGVEHTFKFGKSIKYDLILGIEIFYDSKSSLGILLNDENHDKYFWGNHSIRGRDRHLFHYEFSSIRFRQISYGVTGHAKLICLGSCTKFAKEITDYQIPENSSIYYLELEGLQIEFESRTQTRKFDEFQKEEHYSHSEFNYTTTQLYLPDDHIENVYKAGLIIKFMKNENVDNVILHFDSDIKPVIHVSFTEYQAFKGNLISFLGMINGGEVEVKKEYFGRSFRINGLGAEIERTYFGNSINTTSISNYIPIRDPFLRQERILNKAMDAFPDFCKLNMTYDLSSTIDLLNDTNNSKTIEQRFYGLISSFERLSHKHVYLINDHKDEIIENETLDQLISEYMDVLAKYSDSLEDKELEGRIKQIVRGLKRKRKNSVYKMFKILDDYNVATNDRIVRLIKVFRHTSVHEGEFGDSIDEKTKNYLLLDKLLRDIILNMIDYKGIRSEASY